MVIWSSKCPGAAKIDLPILQNFRAWQLVGVIKDRPDEVKVVVTE